MRTEFNASQMSSSWSTSDSACLNNVVFPQVGFLPFGIVRAAAICVLSFMLLHTCLHNCLGLHWNAWFPNLVCLLYGITHLQYPTLYTECHIWRFVLLRRRSEVFPNTACVCFLYSMTSNASKTIVALPNVCSVVLLSMLCCIRCKEGKPKRHQHA